MDGSARYHLVILRNEMAGDHVNWIKACEHRAERLSYRVIDLSADHWHDRLAEAPVDGLLVQPSGWSARMRSLYEERLRVIARERDVPMIPAVHEVALYENKRALARWLVSNGIAHPRTDVFDRADDAHAFARQAGYPLVAKTSLGAGGSGVRILRSPADAHAYIDRTFTGAGAPRDSGPKWRRAGFVGRAMKKLSEPAALMERIKEYRAIRQDAQRDHVLFQAFVPHAFEWRAVRIGDSFFAHKKLLRGEMASGSLLKEYGDPPRALLDLVRSITDAHGFRSVAIDLFEDPRGDGFLVNEIQCVFGQSDPHQMIVDGIPGRYRWSHGTWSFEPGDHNRYESYLLRLDHLVAILDARYTTASTAR